MNSTANIACESPQAEKPRGLPGKTDFHTVSVAEGYARWAAIYDLTLNPLLAREERYLLPLLLELHSKSVLDLACGTGRWLEKLTAQGIQSVGIDCSVPMLRVASAKHAINGRFASAACESLPFPGGTFDLAICSFALGHIQDMNSMVRELARVMKTGAEVFVSDLHPEAYARGWRVGFRDGSTAVQIEMQCRSAVDVAELFRTNGFNSEPPVPLWLGASEEPLFARAGKLHAFAEACQLPAVLVYHFRRMEPSGIWSAG